MDKRVLFKLRENYKRKHFVTSCFILLCKKMMLFSTELQFVTKRGIHTAVVKVQYSGWMLTSLHNTSQNRNLKEGYGDCLLSSAGLIYHSYKAMKKSFKNLTNKFQRSNIVEKSIK